MSNKTGSSAQVMKIYKGDINHFSGMQRLLSTGEYSDVTICIGNTEIPAHKVILTAVIPYFVTMFNDQFTEANEKSIDLKGVDGEAIADLVKFAYTSELIVTVDNVQSLFEAADYFHVEKVKLFCEDFLVEHLDLKNAIGVRNLGERFKSDELVRQADKIISKNFVEIASDANKEFLALGKDDLVALLARSDLVVQSENDVLKALKVWINNDINTRFQYARELLKTIRLVQVESHELADFANFPRLSSSHLCTEIINDAIKCLQEPSKLNEGDVGLTLRRGYLQGDVYLLGGSFTKEKIRTFVGDNFEQKANLEDKRVAHGVAVLNGNVHVTGGYDDSNVVDSCEMYSPSDDKSTRTSAMNFKRSNHGCCVHKGKIYVCGGKDAFASSCCERLETVEGKWRFKASMNVVRVSFAVVSCGKFMWAFGGWNDGGDILKSVEFYNEEEDLWKISTPMNEGRSDHAAVAFRNKIYVLGGWNGTRIKTVELFDPIVKQFSLITPMLSRRCKFAATISGEKIYCFGGWISRGSREIYQDSVESFDMIAEEWGTEKNMPEKNYGLAAVTVYEG